MESWTSFARGTAPCRSNARINTDRIGASTTRLCSDLQIMRLSNDLLATIISATSACA
jgi:hypothetical protein